MFSFYSDRCQQVGSTVSSACSPSVPRTQHFGSFTVIFHQMDINQPEVSLIAGCCKHLDLPAVAEAQ